jgi:3-hydroxyisobutyrate dehydrogenase-like beta-hydroxyacid dehydrogenase
MASMLDIRWSHARGRVSVEDMSTDTHATAPRIAFLGLGLMGAPMARRLLDAGYPLTVWNRTASRAEPFAALGAQVAPSAAAAVKDADVVITMLADPAAVSAVIDEIGPELRPGTRLIDTSSIGPDAVRATVARLPQGVSLVDAPVMGSVDRAATGELLILAGGDTAPVRDILGHLGGVRQCGESGTGAALKLVLINAIIGGVVITGEALALGARLGLDETMVREGLAASPLGALLQRALATTAHYPVTHAAKDVRLATAAGDLPVSRTVLDVLGSHPDLAAEDLARITDQLVADATR